MEKHFHNLPRAAPARADAGRGTVTDGETGAPRLCSSAKVSPRTCFNPSSGVAVDCNQPRRVVLLETHKRQACIARGRNMLASHCCCLPVKVLTSLWGGTERAPRVAFALEEPQGHVGMPRFWLWGPGRPHPTSLHASTDTMAQLPPGSALP